MTDEELDALVKQAMDRAIERLQKLNPHAGRPAWDQVICEELSEPFAALRAQLAEAREQTALGMVDVMATAAKEAREKALREAAGVLTDEIDLARIAMPQVVPILAADRNAILALIEALAAKTAV